MTPTPTTDELIKGIEFIKDNWDRIPKDFKDTNKYGNHSIEETIWLLDRQKPSVEQSWDFDEERIGIRQDGTIVWGFDSGCSCPSPWEDGEEDYTQVKTYKEFEVNIEDFDEGWLEECLEEIAKIKQAIGDIK